VYEPAWKHRGLTSSISSTERQRIDEEKDKPTITAAQRVNRRCERPFNRWLNAELQKGVLGTLEDWATGGAHLFECSQITTMRYLEKRISPMTGDLTIDVNRNVRFRKNMIEDLEE